MAALRNRLAHAVIVDVEPEFAEIQSLYRGRSTTLRLWRPEMGFAHKMARETSDALDYLLPKVADLNVWAAAMGFDEGGPT